MDWLRKVFDFKKSVKELPSPQPSLFSGGSNYNFKESFGGLLNNIEPLRTFDAICDKQSLDSALASYSGWQNSIASIGTNNSLSQYNTFLMKRLSYQECAYLSNDPFISRAINTIVNEMFKEGGLWDLGDITDFDFDKPALAYNLLDTARIACLRALEYGGALIYIDTTDDNISEPLHFNSWTLSTSRLRGFRVVEPWQYAPVLVNAVNPLLADYMHPELWWVNGATNNVHHTRLIPVTFFSVVDLLKPLYNYMGLPLAYFMRDFVSSAEASRKCVADMLLRFKTDYVKTTAQKIANPETKARIKFMNESRNNYSTVLLTEDEEMAQIVTPITGLGDIVSQQYEIMTAITGLPITKFMGQTPRGFNATGEHDLKNHYDTIAGYQANILKPVLTRLAKAVCYLSQGQAINPDYSFNPVDRLTAKEKAEIANLTMDAVNKAVQAGIATAEDALIAVQKGDFTFEWVDPENMPDMLGDLGDEGFNTQDEWKEDKHPRDKDGKFGSGSSASKIKLKGDELGSFSDDKELRKAAEKFYRENLQGTTATHPEIGKVNFTRKGIKETVTFSADATKLKMIPALKNIIETGKAGEWEKLNHPRNDDIVAFIPITNTVNIAEKKANIEVLIGKDSNGNLYYDMFLNDLRRRFQDNKQPLVTYPKQNQGPQGVERQSLASTDNITPSHEEINIFLEEL